MGADRGAFGFLVSGCGERWLGPPDAATRPPLRVCQAPAVAPPPGRGFHRDEDRARALLADGRVVELDCARGEARLCGPAELAPELLVHPYLGVMAGLASRMLGRDALHGGAFVMDGGAWVVLAARDGGKSTLLAALSAAGVTVLADDLAVLDRGRVLRGPRCVDLRRELPASIGDAVTAQPVQPTPLELVRGGTRLRVSLPPAPDSTELRGFVRLRFGTRLALARVPPSERLQALAGQRVWSAIAANPRATLATASLPVFELEQPRALERIGETVALLADGLPRAA
jgi:hypothetical protein